MDNIIWKKLSICRYVYNSSDTLGCKKKNTSNIFIIHSGYGKPDKVKIYGSLENLELFAYYIKDGKVIAMSSVAADPVVSDFANFLYEGNSLTEEMIDKNPFGWIRNKPKNLLERFENECNVNP